MILNKKLSFKSVCGKPTLDAENPLSMTVFGSITSYRTVVTTYGESYGFLGTIRAINQDGEQYDSREVFLPQVAEDLLVEAVDALPEGQRVEFAFRISLAPNTSGKEGGAKYIYVVESLLERVVDPLAALASTISHSPALVHLAETSDEDENPF